MDQGSTIATRHSAKACNTKRTSAGGILFTMRSGAVAYIEYGGPLALEYTPSIDGGLESIRGRIGDSFITIEGRCLYPLLEEMRARKCDQVRESDHKLTVIGVLYVECITVHLWL
jgi:hypothetical protein